MKVIEYVLKLDQFEGPLDLLLHLVQRTKVDIMNLSITEITDQYLQYISELQSMDLEIASEYILMSAQLIEMKSRMLLPKQQVDQQEEIDPREELIQRLLEYKKYKDVTASFREFEQQRQQVYAKGMSDISGWLHEETVLNTERKKDVYQLVKVFEKMLKYQSFTQHTQAVMKRQEITIEDQLQYLQRTVASKQRVKLSELFENQERPYVVTTFLAVLQMVRTQQLVVEQDENFADIELFALSATKQEMES